MNTKISQSHARKFDLLARSLRKCHACRCSRVWVAWSLVWHRRGSQAVRMYGYYSDSCLVLIWFNSIWMPAAISSSIHFVSQTFPTWKSWKKFQSCRPSGLWESTKSSHSTKTKSERSAMSMMKSRDNSFSTTGFLFLHNLCAPLRVPQGSPVWCRWHGSQRPGIALTFLDMTSCIVLKFIWCS